MELKKQKTSNKGVKIISATLAASLLAVPALLLNGAPTSAASQIATTTVNVRIDPTIAISATPNIDINITPTASGQFQTGDGRVSISTNNTKGYTTYITSSTADTDLKQPSSAGVSTTIPSVTASANTISGTAWGWSNDATQFNPVKVAGTTDNSAVFSKTTTATPTGDNKTLTVGASATTSVPEGAYSNTLLFTAITNN